MELVNRKSKIEKGSWLPDMDLNHDKQIQSLLCYRYTIGQAGAGESLGHSRAQSSRQTAERAGERRLRRFIDLKTTGQRLLTAVRTLKRPEGRAPGPVRVCAQSVNRKS